MKFQKFHYKNKMIQLICILCYILLIAIYFANASSILSSIQRTSLLNIENTTNFTLPSAEINPLLEKLTFVTSSQSENHRKTVPIAMTLLAFSLFGLIIFIIVLTFHNKLCCFKTKEEEKDIEFASSMLLSFNLLFYTYVQFFLIN